MYEVSEAGFYAVDGLFWEFLAYVQELAAPC